MNSKHTFFGLLRYLWPKDRRDLQFKFLIAVACLLVARGLNVCIPLVFGQAVDQLTGDIISIPVAMLVTYGLVRLGSGFFNEMRDFFFIGVSQNAQRRVALETFKHLHRLSLHFHLNRQTGGLSRVIERGVKGISFALSFLSFNVLPTIIEILLVTGILYYRLGWKFALIVFSTISFYIFYTIFVTEWRVKFRRQMIDSDNRANTKAVDSLLNYETVKYFGNEQHEYQRYDRSLKGYEQAAILSQKSLSVLNLGQALTIATGLVVLMYLAAEGVVNGAMSVGDFVVANTFLIQLYTPLNFLGFVYREMKQSFIDMEQMFEMLRQDDYLPEPEDGRTFTGLSKGIAFENVHFSYQPNRPILKDVSFHIKPGQKVAFVGASGAGKSTLFRLLFRFYDVTQGKITVDGVDIREFNTDSLRQGMGVVPQDTVLFNDTIQYNIRYGDPAATDDKIIESAKQAQVASFIEHLPEGYLTRVGERGLKLSGGEKQRVAIARTLLKDPDILILDEATSALDSETEQAIQGTLEEVSKGRTTLVIAHRLSTIVQCDQIFVLDQGKIVETGTHQQLLDKKMYYYRLWVRQQEKAQLEKQLKKATQAAKLVGSSQSLSDSDSESI